MVIDTIGDITPRLNSIVNELNSPVVEWLNKGFMSVSSPTGEPLLRRASCVLCLLNLMRGSLFPMVTTAINHELPSERRATVLSVKGVMYQLCFTLSSQVTVLDCNCTELLLYGTVTVRYQLCFALSSQ
eukprot:563765-Pyramimonas_sp.AAC.2